VELRLAVSGSQYLGVAASLKLPMSALDGVCVLSSGAPEVQVDFILTPTVIAALDVMRSVGSVVGPISAASASPASAVAVTRLAILQALLSCDVDLAANNGNSLLGLSLGPRTGAYMRGAVVGNILIVLGFAAATLFLILGFSLYGRVAHGHAIHRTVGMLQAIFHVPGVLMLPIAAVCQPTLTACVQLVVLQPVEGDRVLGVIGLCVVVGLMLLPFTFVISTHFFLELTSTPKSPAGADDEGLSPPRRLVRVLFGDRARWVPTSHNADALRWKKQFIPIFVDCGTWWFPLADMWISAAVGVVGGLTLSNTNVCRGQLSVVGIAYLASFLIQVSIVKRLVLASKVYSVLIQLLGVVSCAAVTVALVQDQEEETVSVTVATYTMLMIAVLSTLKSLVDFIALCIAFPIAMRKAYSQVTSLPPPAALKHEEQEEQEQAMEAEELEDVEHEAYEEPQIAPDSLVAEPCSDVDIEGDGETEDAMFIAALLDGGGETSLINEMSAPEECLGAPFDFLRDVQVTSLREGASSFNEVIDFADLVFTDGSATSEARDSTGATPDAHDLEFARVDAIAALQNEGTVVDDAAQHDASVLRYLSEQTTTRPIKVNAADFENSFDGSALDGVLPEFVVDDEVHAVE
jgi:hypothetical protein